MKKFKYLTIYLFLPLRIVVEMSTDFFVLKLTGFFHIDIHIEIKNKYEQKFQTLRHFHIYYTRVFKICKIFLAEA